MICPFCDFELPDKNYIGITRCEQCSRAFSVYYAEGKQLLRKQLYDKAIENFHLALKYFKNTAMLHLDLALAYKKIGNEPKAKDALNRAKEIDIDLYESVVTTWS